MTENTQQEENFEFPTPTDVEEQAIRLSTTAWKLRKEIAIFILLIVLIAYFGFNVIWFLIAFIAWIFA